MATVFCTNHIRQVGVHIVKAIKHHDKKDISRLGLHCGMLGCFILGGILSTILGGWFAGKAIWFALIPLGIVFVDLLRADLIAEKDYFEKIPAGH